MSFKLNERITTIRKELKLSQSAFGEHIGVSRDVIKNIDNNIVDAETKPLLVQQICKEYNVNRAWLETGEGNMFNDLSRDAEIAEYIGSVLADEEDSFQKRLISALSKMTVDEWEALEKLVTRLAGNEENKKEDEA